MAMKLTQSEKVVDSQIRAFNAQIEKAYKTLGYNHTVTRNLVATANSLFKCHIKEMTIKSVNRNQIDMSTGEVFAIPQIMRGRKTLQYAMNEKIYSITDKKQKTVAETLQKNTHTSAGTYKKMFDVSKARQNAIEREMQRRRVQAVNNGMTNLSDIDRYQRSYTEQELMRQLYYDVIASDIFEKYHKAREQGDDDIEDYRRFADYYNNGEGIEDIDEILANTMEKRQVTLHRLDYTQDELEQERLQGQSIVDYLDYL